MTTTTSLDGLMAPDWARALTDAGVADQVGRMGEMLTGMAGRGEAFLPPGDRVLRAFSRPMSAVRVLVVGQDPYPTPGHAVGLSFSVERDVRPVPRSLQNIYAELSADLGIEPAAHGDLSSWFDQGVLLLNRVLTVSPGKPGSHQGKGWEKVTDAAVAALVARQRDEATRAPLVGLLWGRQARQFTPTLLAAGVPVVESAHPSPLSADYGFFGSRPFSKVNALLAEQGGPPIDWRLP